MPSYELKVELQLKFLVVNTSRIATEILYVASQVAIKIFKMVYTIQKLFITQ
jgi:hypothetical protein